MHECKFQKDSLSIERVFEFNAFINIGLRSQCRSKFTAKLSPCVYCEPRLLDERIYKRLCVNMRAYNRPICKPRPTSANIGP